MGQFAVVHCIVSTSYPTSARCGAGLAVVTSVSEQVLCFPLAGVVNVLITLRQRHRFYISRCPSIYQQLLPTTIYQRIKNNVVFSFGFVRCRMVLIIFIWTRIVEHPSSSCTYRMVGHRTIEIIIVEPLEQPLALTFVIVRLTVVYNEASWKGRDPSSTYKACKARWPEFSITRGSYFVGGLYILFHLILGSQVFIDCNSNRCR